MRRRRDRDGRRRRVVPTVLEPANERREPIAIDGTEVEKSHAASRDLAGHDVARGELVGKAVTPRVEQERSLAAQRLGQEKRRVDERRRVELDELEIRECGACPVRGCHPIPERARRIRRPLPQC